MPDYQLFGVDPVVQQRHIAAIGSQIRGLTGLQRMKAGLAAMKNAGLVADQNNAGQVRQAMKDLPGPFGDGDPREELGHFLNFAEGASYAPFDPTGYPGGRYTGLSGGDPRDDGTERDACDVFGIIAGDVAAGSTGASANIINSALDTEYRRSVLWLWTDGGKVRNITEIKVDNRVFYLGPSASVPADLCDVTLEPHPRRQGIYLGTIKKSLSVTAFIATSATAVHWEALLDGEVDNMDTQRPSGRILSRRAAKLFQ